MKSDSRHTQNRNKDCFSEIILSGGERLLSHERQFDKAVCSTLWHILNKWIK